MLFRFYANLQLILKVGFFKNLEHIYSKYIFGFVSLFKIKKFKNSVEKFDDKTLPMVKYFTS